MSTSTRTPRPRSSTWGRRPRCAAACAPTSRSRAPATPRPTPWSGQIRDLEYIVTTNELEALILESNLVKKHRPRYNIILRDDKHYPFLKLTTSEEFPRLVVARRVQQDGDAYFGPFYPATAMRETLRLVRQLFPLRTCRIKIDGQLPRPCIQYFIHRCNAPCTGQETEGRLCAGPSPRCSASWRARTTISSRS